jgi:hypothetical protein
MMSDVSHHRKRGPCPLIANGPNVLVGCPVVRTEA